jgi:hypothetical protein
MAHSFRIKTVPHINKDGKPSATKHDYVVIDRTRSGSIEVGVVTSQKAANDLIDAARKMLHSNHLRNHPNDRAFGQKHGYEGVSK